MAMKFDKEKLVDAVKTIHDDINLKVLEYAQVGYDAFHGIPDDNAQKEQFNEAMQQYQNTYNAFTGAVDKMLANFDSTFELGGALDKYISGTVTFRENEVEVKVIDTDQVAL